MLGSWDSIIIFKFMLEIDLSHYDILYSNMNLFLWDPIMNFWIVSHGTMQIRNLEKYWNIFKNCFLWERFSTLNNFFCLLFTFINVVKMQ